MHYEHDKTTIVTSELRIGYILRLDTQVHKDMDVVDKVAQLEKSNVERNTQVQVQSHHNKV